jgi:hypothetical protein
VVLVTGGGAGGTADAACACARLNNAGPLAHITRSCCFAKGAHNNNHNFLSFDLGILPGVYRCRSLYEVVVCCPPMHPKLDICRPSVRGISMAMDRTQSRWRLLLAYTIYLTVLCSVPIVDMPPHESHSQSLRGSVGGTAYQITVRETDTRWRFADRQQIMSATAELMNVYSYLAVLAHRSGFAWSTSS